MPLLQRGKGKRSPPRCIAETSCGDVLNTCCKEKTVELGEIGKSSVVTKAAKDVHVRSKSKYKQKKGSCKVHQEKDKTMCRKEKANACLWPMALLL